MGIYFRDILLIRISRGSNNCVQHVFDFFFFYNDILPHFKFLFSKERLKNRSKGLTTQIYFHSFLWSYLPRVPTILTTCVGWPVYQHLDASSTAPPHGTTLKMDVMLDIIGDSCFNSHTSKYDFCNFGIGTYLKLVTFKHLHLEKRCIVHLLTFCDNIPQRQYCHTEWDKLSIWNLQLNNTYVLFGINLYSKTIK